MIRANVEWKPRCPHCGSTEYSKSEGFHFLGRYKCHECKRNFFKPAFTPMPSKEYIRIRHRASELEAGMEHLLRRHGWAVSIEQLYSYIPDYVTYQEDWEESYCKGYLLKRVRRGYRRYDRER